MFGMPFHTCGRERHHIQREVKEHGHLGRFFDTTAKFFFLCAAGTYVRVRTYTVLHKTAPTITTDDRRLYNKQVMHKDCIAIKGFIAMPLSMASPHGTTAHRPVRFRRNNLREAALQNPDAVAFGFVSGRWSVEADRRSYLRSRRR